MTIEREVTIAGQTYPVILSDENEALQAAKAAVRAIAVSYTHLDVYKRQSFRRATRITRTHGLSVVPMRLAQISNFRIPKS